MHPESWNQVGVPCSLLSEDFIQEPGFQGKAAHSPQQCQSRDTAQKNSQWTGSGCPPQLCSGVRCPPLVLLAGWTKVGSDAGRLTRPLAMRLGQIGTKAPLEPRVCVAVSGLQCAAANSEAAHSGAGESSLAFQGRWV